jgi:single-strand DNA-binding protein
MERSEYVTMYKNSLAEAFKAAGVELKKRPEKEDSGDDEKYSCENRGRKPRGGCGMNHLNSVLIEGNLTGDPLFRDAPKGVPVCAFTIASNHFCKSDGGLEKEVCFFDIEARSKLAEKCRNLGRKGIGVRVVGRLKQDRWYGADGVFHSDIFIVAEHVEFRPEKDGGDGRVPDKGESPPGGGFKELPF